MTEFSKLLSSYIKERKTNISALASEIGTERTLLHKYISGTRTPSDIKTVSAIAKGLMLSFDEKNRLIRLYKIASMGEDVYMRSLRTEKIIRFLSEIPEPDILHQQGRTDTLLSCAVNDKFSVETTIGRILEDDRSKNIFVCTPPSHKFIYRELSDICVNRSDTNITHLITFGSSDDYIGNNLEIFIEILPLLIFGRKYTPLINYSHPAVREDSLQFMTNLILTDNYAFSFNNNLDSGILHTESGILKLYKKLSVRVCDRSYELIHTKISSAPKETDDIIKINKNLYIEKSEKNISLIFKKDELFYRIMIYEQSLRKVFTEFLSGNAQLWNAHDSLTSGDCS